MKIGLVAAFFAIASAFHEIKNKKLYLGSHTSFAAYFQDKWNYGRAHAYRLAAAGEIIERMSPNGDVAQLLTTEGHYRPLSKLLPAQQKEAVQLVGKWAKEFDQSEVSPRLVESAVAYLHPAIGPTATDETKLTLVGRCVEVVVGIEKQLPNDTAKDVRQLFKQMKKKVEALGNPRRSSGIDWTEATWNPLQGCARASAGCDYCYAAKLVATRLAGVYPGLASELKKGGKKTYLFNNIIRLLPEQLGEPLKDRTPKRYFVNSMSDLFHANVPDEFIKAVFQVMEQAHWHQFQVLTKRTARMAEFTAAYWEGKQPAANIWLGTSTENQATLDERLPHLLKVKTAVRWLSMEPLIGPIKFASLDRIDWVVVGGESGSDRKMEKVWATDIRDACDKAGVPFFFKQWGAYNEEGKKARKQKKDGLTPAAIDGVIHNDYPLPVLIEEVARSQGQ